MSTEINIGLTKAELMSIISGIGFGLEAGKFSDGERKEIKELLKKLSSFIEVKNGLNNGNGIGGSSGLHGTGSIRASTTKADT